MLLKANLCVHLIENLSMAIIIIITKKSIYYGVTQLGPATLKEKLYTLQKSLMLHKSYPA
jgi:hypothetical protein